MPRPLRRLVLTLHVGCSVGWLGASLAMLVLSVVGNTTNDLSLRHAAFTFMHYFDLVLNIPLGFIALFTGIALSVWTNWGLFSHYWIATKFALTTAVLAFASVWTSRWVHQAVDAAPSVPNAVFLRLVVNSICFLMTFWTMAALSVFKPWGKTPRGRRLAARIATTARARGVSQVTS